MVPPLSVLVPIVTMMSRINGVSTFWGIILVLATYQLPMSVFLYSSFITTIPYSLDEAATIDGANFAQRFTKVIVPLSQTGLATAGTFCFIYSWNEFIMALLLTSSEASRTLQLGIRFFTSQFVTDYTAMYAAIIITIIPSIIVYFIFHNRIISGLTAGAVKG